MIRRYKVNTLSMLTHTFHSVNMNKIEQVECVERGYEAGMVVLVLEV